tara:strand:+ start:1473 stop:2717 length:1245 start_codon:yes stop_codon:yes gene_type:complete
MRLGLSTKITQQNLRPQPATGYTPQSASLTLNLDTNTFHRKNADGRLYNISFPYDFVKWSTNSRYAADASTPSTVVTDPFSDYREAGDPTVYTDSLGNNWNMLPRIRDYLTINLELDSADVLGCNNVYFTFPEAAITLYISESGQGTDTHFTSDAADNLVVNIKNSGIMGGGGGPGGHGIEKYIVAGKTTVTTLGGGGGGGAGIHQTPSPTASTRGQMNTDNALPGQGGHGPGNATDGGAGENGAGGSWPGAWAGGAAGASSTTGTYTSQRLRDAGQTGGSVVNIINTQWRTESAGVDADSTPTINVINEDDAYLYGGSGGGGGGGSNQLNGQPQAGGAGGGRASATSMVNAGTAGSGTYNFGEFDQRGGAGGTAGSLIMTNFLTARSPADTTITNNHKTGNSVVTVEGSERAY